MEVTTILVKNHWPLRQHATYGESVKVIMDVFERVQREQGRFVPRWAIDHAETVRDEELRRIKAMGGGIAIQDRLAFAGESFVERYGQEAARDAPPVRQMLQMGLPVGAGTDGTRVSSYNPWPALYWLVSGKTVGGTPLFADDNTLSRAEALRLFTVGSAGFSQEEDVKGRIAPGQYADFAVLSADYLTVPEEQIKDVDAALLVLRVFAGVAFVARTAWACRQRRSGSTSRCAPRSSSSIGSSSKRARRSAPIPSASTRSCRTPCNAMASTRRRRARPPGTCPEIPSGR
jgi:predicted amidohydrolase YtcJ